MTREMFEFIHRKLPKNLPLFRILIYISLLQRSERLKSVIIIVRDLLRVITGSEAR
jgi:hypothetical protein